MLKKNYFQTGAIYIHQINELDEYYKVVHFVQRYCSVYECSKAKVCVSSALVYLPCYYWLHAPSYTQPWWSNDYMYSPPTYIHLSFWQSCDFSRAYVVRLGYYIPREPLLARSRLSKLCPSVRLSHACFVTKQKKLLLILWYEWQFIEFSDTNNGWLADTHSKKRITA